MPAFYYLDTEDIHTHIPKHPERTLYGGRSPISIYYREFSTRTTMGRWLRQQTWKERQAWHPWMSLEKNHIQIARHASMLRRQSASIELQPTLF